MTSCRRDKSIHFFTVYKKRRIAALYLNLLIRINLVPALLPAVSPSQTVRQRVRFRARQVSSCMAGMRSKAASRSLAETFQYSLPPILKVPAGFRPCVVTGSRGSPASYLLAVLIWAPTGVPRRPKVPHHRIASTHLPSRSGRPTCGRSSA